MSELYFMGLKVARKTEKLEFIYMLVEIHGNVVFLLNSRLLHERTRKVLFCKAIIILMVLVADRLGTRWLECT